MTQNNNNKTFSKKIKELFQDFLQKNKQIDKKIEELEKEIKAQQIKKEVNKF